MKCLFLGFKKLSSVYGNEGRNLSGFPDRKPRIPLDRIRPPMEKLVRGTMPLIKIEKPSPTNFEVLAETKDWIVLNKPAGIDCQPSRDDRTSIAHFLEQNFQFAGLVHRLDFNTSGALICAKNPKAAKQLSSAFQSGEVKKIYLAIVLGKVEKTETSIDSEIEGQSAHTECRVMESFPNSTLLEVQIHTGRKHQIRKHLLSIGHPILGDMLYKKGGNHLLFKRPALHAKRLEILGLSFEAPLPKDFEELLLRLRQYKC